MEKTVNISVYFMWEWWEKYFHCTFPRPAKSGDDELDWMYLKRKRFLWESFGEYGIGEEVPVMDGKYVNLVIKWGMDFIPHVLGANLTCQEAGGYAVQKMDIDVIKRLKPVEVAGSPAGEWILNRKSELLKRYGSAEQSMDLESPTNVAVRIRGEEFYMDLIEDEGLAKHILDVVTETICGAYGFLGREFKLDELLIGNCNVTLMSPSLYERMIFDYDVKLAGIAENLTGRKNSVRLHHCNAPVDKFIEVYKKIPDVSKLEASHTSDISKIHMEMPGTAFSAMVNPVELLQKPFKQLEEEIERSVAEGAGELDIWNIDPSMDISQLKSLFALLRRCCEKNNCRAEFNCIPFCWDELEWAFPRYMGV